METLAYKRSRFSTQLPVPYLYTPSHTWLARQAQGVWRVGLTRFATRMLGEMVDHGFESEAGEAVQCGQVIGWVEGFKAISDIFCVVEGEFARNNPALHDRIHLVSKDPYQEGWLYEIRGHPDPGCLDVHGYAELLDRTIDAMLQRQQAEGA